MSLEEEVDCMKDLLKSLNKMRLNGTVCDGILGTEDQATFRVHRSVMATCSPYFKTLFTTPLRGQGGGEGGDRKFVVVPGISGKLLGAIIDYAYTRTVKIDMKNVYELLIAADQFGVEDMAEDCCNFLIKKLNYKNCIGIWDFSRPYFFQKLTQCAWNYIMKNFTEICRFSQELWALPCKSLKEILQSDQLLVDDERQVWYCILIWIYNDPEERGHMMPELLATVRLGLLTAEFFEHEIKLHPFVCGNRQCQPIITKATKVKHGLSNTQLHSTSFTYMMRARLPESLIFCVGGWGGNGPTNTMDVYDHNADSWITSSCGDHLGPRAYHRCVILDSYLYVIGGTDGQACLNSCRKFEISNRTWEHIAPMHKKRCYVSCVTVNNAIYAIGGYDGTDRLSSCERYDPSTNQWTLISSMESRRSDSGACTIKESIFVVGGFCGETYLNSVEVYDTSKDTWTTIKRMSCQRSGVSCVAIDSCCFVMGGYNGDDRLTSCEIYNTRVKRWMLMPSMNKCRSNFAAAALDGFIYACGGYNGSQTIPDVERFNMRTGVWETMCPMSTALSALACCVVTNASEYAPKQRCRARKFIPPQKTRSGWNRLLPGFI